MSLSSVPTFDDLLKKRVELDNLFVEQKFRGFDYCRVGPYGRKHLLMVVDHADGRITIEPACKTGYYGESSERVQPVSSLAEGEFCRRLRCVYGPAGRWAPRYAAPVRVRQLELDLLAE